jgi:hypothetical protein
LVSEATWQPLCVQKVFVEAWVPSVVAIECCCGISGKAALWHRVQSVSRLWGNSEAWQWDVGVEAQPTVWAFGLAGPNTDIG